MRWGHGVLELLLARGTGVPGPVLGHQSWTSSPLQVPKLRGLVWTAGTVLPVLPIPDKTIGTSDRPTRYIITRMHSEPDLR